MLCAVLSWAERLRHAREATVVCCRSVRSLPVTMYRGALYPG